LPKLFAIVFAACEILRTWWKAPCWRLTPIGPSGAPATRRPSGRPIGKRNAGVGELSLQPNPSQAREDSLS